MKAQREQSGDMPTVYSDGVKSWGRGVGVKK